MPSNKNLVALKDCYKRIEDSSSRLDALFRKRTKELFDAFIHELEELDGQTHPTVIRDKKIYEKSFDRYYSEISPGISQQILWRLRADDRECARILELPSNTVPDKLENFVYELFDREIEKIEKVIEKATLFTKKRNSVVDRDEYSMELSTNIREIKKEKSKLKRQRSVLESKHKALFLIIKSISSTISDGGMKFFLKQRTKMPKNQVEPKESKTVKKVTVKKQEQKTVVLKKPVAKKPVEKKPVTKKSIEKKTVEKKPTEKKPVAKKTVVKTPVVKRVATKKTVAKKPVVKKSAEKKPVTKKSIVKKPVVKKTVVKKPVVKKTIAKKPTVKKSKTGTMPKIFVMNIFTKLRKIMSQNTKIVKR